MNMRPEYLARNLEFDHPIRNTLSLSKSERMLGATHFVNGNRHFVRIIETNPFGIDPTLVVVACVDEKEARNLFNDMQCDGDSVLARLGIR